MGLVSLFLDTFVGVDPQLAADILVSGLGASALSVARFSEAFLVLRADDVGLTLALVPLVMVVMSVAYTLSAYPAGVLSDRMDRRALIVLGLLVLIAVDLVLALATGIRLVLVGAALWGLHMGLTQGLLAAMVADATPERIRGIAFRRVPHGDRFGAARGQPDRRSAMGPVRSPATYYAGMAFAGIALIGLLVVRRRDRVRP